jgi:membrane-bound serine protease (ClpP class)
VAILAAVVMAYSDFGARTGNLVLLVVVAGLIAGSLAYVKFFPDSRFARVFVSQRVIGDVGAEQPELLNQTGTALTTLRPSGMALIAGRRVDVVSEGALIEKGAAVKVVAIEGMRTVVRAA